MKRMTAFWQVSALAALLAGTPGSLHAREFRIEDVPSATAVGPSELKPGTIVLSDHRSDNLADPTTGLIKFEDWERDRPEQKRILSLYPGYEEPHIQVSVHGIKRPYTEKLHMYRVDARFLIDRSPDSIDLGQYVRLDVLEKIDPAIKHRRIEADQARPLTDPELAYNRNPERRWCEAPQSLCVESHYPLEGKLPIGIKLVNKIQDSEKTISTSMDFQTELRVLQPQDIDRESYAKLTGLDAPVTGVLEQTVFSVNQIMQFGKLVTVLQEDKADPAKTVASVFVALAIETDVIERKKEFEDVPVLRNLIPAQVLMGKSSFNSGSSISAGLPKYTRNRIQAVATLLDKPE